MKIAIIDDEKEILNILDKFLSKKDHAVTTYQNPVTALSSIKKDTDIVLLDVMMPQMNGLDLLPKLLEKYPKIKVIIMTAYSTLDKVLKAHRGGAVYYEMKPFKSLASLEAKIIEVSQIK
ncbi:MAG: response regulator [Campylobacterota bacterium]|nr:response regulator [Campylobacterota bacterium]